MFYVSTLAQEGPEASLAELVKVCAFPADPTRLLAVQTYTLMRCVNSSSSPVEPLELTHGTMHCTVTGSPDCERSGELPRLWRFWRLSLLAFVFEGAYLQDWGQRGFARLRRFETDEER